MFQSVSMSTLLSLLLVLFSIIAHIDASSSSSSTLAASPYMPDAAATSTSTSTSFIPLSSMSLPDLSSDDASLIDQVVAMSEGKTPMWMQSETNIQRQIEDMEHAFMALAVTGVAGANDSFLVVSVGRRGGAGLSFVENTNSSLNITIEAYQGGRRVFDIGTVSATLFTDHGYFLFSNTSGLTFTTGTGTLSRRSMTTMNVDHEWNDVHGVWPVTMEPLTSLTEWVTGTTNDINTPSSDNHNTHILEARPSTFRHRQHTLGRDSSVAFSGSLIDMNTALNSLTFVPESNYNGPMIIEYAITAPGFPTVRGNESTIIQPGDKIIVPPGPANQTSINNNTAETPLPDLPVGGVRSIYQVCSNVTFPSPDVFALQFDADIAKVLNISIDRVRVVNITRIQRENDVCLNVTWDILPGGANDPSSVALLDAFKNLTPDKTAGTTWVKGGEPVRVAPKCPDGTYRPTCDGTGATDVPTAQPQTSSSSSFPWWAGLIIGLVVGLCCLFLIIFFFCYYRRKPKRKVSDATLHSVQPTATPAMKDAPAPITTDVQVDEKPVPRATPLMGPMAMKDAAANVQFISANEGADLDRDAPKLASFASGARASSPPDDVEEKYTNIRPLQDKDTIILKGNQSSPSPRHGGGSTSPLPLITAMSSGTTEEDYVLKTQDAYASLITKPLQAQYLRRPPFLFIRDLVSNVQKRTGLFDGVYDPALLKRGSNPFRSAAERHAFLQKLIDVVERKRKAPLPGVNAWKILAGQEPAKTNLLLQEIAALAHAVLAKKAMGVDPATDDPAISPRSMSDDSPGETNAPYETGGDDAGVEGSPQRSPQQTNLSLPAQAIHMAEETVEEQRAKEERERLRRATLPAYVIRTTDLLIPIIGDRIKDKHVARPPFNFIRDTIRRLNNKTGAFEGVFPPEDISRDSNRVSKPAERLAFLRRLIAYVQLATGQVIDVQPSRILAGAAPEQTNVLLQMMARLSQDPLLDVPRVVAQLNQQQELEEAQKHAEQGGDSDSEQEADIDSSPVGVKTTHSPRSPRGEIADTSYTAQTQKMLEAVIQRKLKEKYLARPPFEFIRDVIARIDAKTGFFHGLFPDDMLTVSKLPDPAQRLVFLTRLITYVSVARGAQIDCDPLKIIAGKEPEKTNYLLQEVARLCQIPTPQRVQQMVAQVESTLHTAWASPS